MSKLMFVTSFEMAKLGITLFLTGYHSLTKHTST